MERAAVSPNSAHALSADLRGITVRNTFLEFEDAGINEFADTGFQRQSSEPIKSFHRNVSDQTTTCSEMMLDGPMRESSSSHPEHENYVQCFFLLQNGAMMADANGQMVGMGASNFGSQRLANSHQTAAAPPARANPQVQQPQSNQLAVVRFCPKCGAEVEPTHSFCPYCCFNLQQIHAQNSQAMPMVQQSVAMPCAMTGYAQQSCSSVCGSETADMLGCIRRFRYIDASTTDIDRARGLCETLMRGMTVA